jgi:hypothetical protein
MAVIAALLKAGHAAANVSAAKAVPIIPLNPRRVSFIINSSSPRLPKVCSSRARGFGRSSTLAENSPQDCKVSQRFGPAASFHLKNKKDLPDHIIHPGTHRRGTQASWCFLIRALAEEGRANSCVKLCGN